MLEWGGMQGGGQCHNSVKTSIFKNSVSSLQADHFSVMILRTYVHTSIGGTKFEVLLSAMSIITRCLDDSLLSHCKHDSSTNVPTSAKCLFKQKMAPE
jgi:hypothetical protein